MTNVLVTGAGGPLGVSLACSFKDAPESLRLIGTDDNRWNLPLSICERTYLVPRASERALYAGALAEVIKAESIDVVVPSHPLEVRAVAELHRHLGAAITLPRPSVLSIAEDKLLTYKRLSERNVAVPQSVALGAPGKVDEAFATITGRPIWVAGTGVPGIGLSGAELACKSPEIARAWVEHHRGWGKMAAIEYLPGASLSWMAGFADGVLLAAGAQECLERAHAPEALSSAGVAPAVSRTVHRDDVAQLAERAVRAIDDKPHGLYLVDVKEDARGALRVVEISAGRCSATTAVYTDCGYNFPWLLVRLARGDSVRPLPAPNTAIEPNVYWLHDLSCTPVAIRGSKPFDAFPRAGVGGGT